MTTVALIALVLVAIDGLVAIAVLGEGLRRHLAGVHLEQRLHQPSSAPR